MPSCTPQVTLLDPAEDVSTDHHGPHSTPYISLGTSSKPRYFKNPWPSYRVASINDAWLSYQKGASIALPLDKATKSGPSTPRPRSPRQYSEEEAVGDDLAESEADEEIAGLLRGSDGAIRFNNGFIRPRIYIRPSFSGMREGDDEDDWRHPPVQVVQPTWGDGTRESVTWLGHAGVLLQLPWKGRQAGVGMCGMLFDPIFSYRCSPSQYVGPARYLDPPCTVQDLPAIHGCFISHDHCASISDDHLDYYTIIDLWKYHSSTVHFFVPLGLKSWFEGCSIPSDRITELDWWHEAILDFSPGSTSSTYGDFDSDPATDAAVNLEIKVAFTPAQHRSGRGVFDHMTTLWGSWCLGVIGDEDKSLAHQRGMSGWKGFKMFFGGDTGYRYATAPEADQTAICPAFQQISSTYGPFSFSCLPLSTGSSLPFLRTLLSLSLDQYILTSSLHCNPADSVAIHKILKSERTLGIHWGTFCDTDEARGTRVDFGRVRWKHNIGRDWEQGQGCFVTSDIGQTLRWPPAS